MGVPFIMGIEVICLFTRFGGDWGDQRNHAILVGFSPRNLAFFGSMGEIVDVAYEGAKSAVFVYRNRRT